MATQPEARLPSPSHTDAAPHRTHIFLDESGFTGQDLLNPHQPIFCIASTALDAATTDRYHTDLLEGSNAREAKHTRLMRRPRGRAKIANFLEQLKGHENAYAVWVCHKQFGLLSYFVDLWLEPAARHAGLDLYKDGAALALSNLTYFALPAHTNEAFLTSILQDFQIMMMSRTKASYERLLSNLGLKYNSSEREVQELLILFVGSVDLLGYEYLRSLPDLPMHLAEAGLVRLCHRWRNRMEGPFVLHHDQSTQLAHRPEVWQMLLSNDMPPMKFGSGHRRAIFPVNVEETLFVSSLTDKQVQLCDVLAGAVATWARGLIRGETSEYLDVLQEVDMQPFVTDTIWPELEVDPDRLETRGLSNEVVEYLAKELTRRGL